MEDIKAAMERYLIADMHIPMEWIDEFTKLEKESGEYDKQRIQKSRIKNIRRFV